MTTIELVLTGKHITVAGSRRSGKTSFLVETVCRWLKEGGLGDQNNRRAYVMVSGPSYVSAMKAAFAGKGVGEPYVKVITPKETQRGLTGLLGPHTLLALDVDGYQFDPAFFEKVASSGARLLKTEPLRDPFFTETYKGLVITGSGDTP